MAVFENLQIRLSMSTAELFKKIRSVYQRLDRLRAMSAAAAAKMAAPAAIITAGFAAIGAKAIQLGSSLQELDSKMDNVFGDRADGVRKWADQFAEVAGRSSTQIKEMATGFQSLFSPMGLSADVGEKMSKSLTRLAVDIGSANDAASEDVFNDLRSAMTGSAETLQKYGIIANETAVAQELLNQGIDPKHANNAQKALARYAIILRGSAAAHNDATETAGSFANTLERFKAQVQTASEALGVQLLPMATMVVNSLMNMVDMFRQTGDSGEKSISPINDLLRLTLDWAEAIAFAIANWDLTIERVKIRLSAWWDFIKDIFKSIGTLSANIGEALYTGFHNGIMRAYNLLGWLGKVVKEIFDYITSLGEDSIDASLPDFSKNTMDYQFQSLPDFHNAELDARTKAVEAEFNRRMQELAERQAKRKKEMENEIDEGLDLGQAIKDAATTAVEKEKEGNGTGTDTEQHKDWSTSAAIKNSVAAFEAIAIAQNAKLKADPVLAENEKQTKHQQKSKDTLEKCLEVLREIDRKLGTREGVAVAAL